MYLLQQRSPAHISEGGRERSRVIPKKKLILCPEEGRGAGWQGIKCPLQEPGAASSARLQKQPKDRVWGKTCQGQSLRVCVLPHQQRSSWGSFWPCRKDTGSWTVNSSNGGRAIGAISESLKSTEAGPCLCLTCIPIVMASFYLKARHLLLV